MQSISQSGRRASGAVAAAPARDPAHGPRRPWPLVDPAHKLPNAVLYRRAEAEACWREVTAPVLLVVGADSAVLEAVGVEASSRSLALPFPDLRTRIIEACGHMVHFEAPGLLAAAIEDFLRPTL